MCSDITKMPWDIVWTLPIEEFFTYVSFKLYKDKKQSEAMNQWKQSH